MKTESGVLATAAVVNAEPCGIESLLSAENSKVMKNYVSKGYMLIIIGLLMNIPSVWILLNIKQSIVFSP